MAFNRYLLIDQDSNSGYIELHPTFDHSEPIRIKRVLTRTMGGQLNSYKIRGGQVNAILPLTHVGSGDASKLNSWWRGRNRLNFQEEIGLFPGAINVRIMNPNIPFPLNVEGQFSQFNGILNLISIDESIYNYTTDRVTKGIIGIFILDSPDFGILDQNRLIG
jgi:hypothetical protein